MKKKLLLLILTCSVLLTMAACGKTDNTTSHTGSENQTTTENDNRTTTGNENVNTDTATDESAETEDSGMVFWFLTQAWDEPKDTFEGGLFNESVTLPLDISTLDSLCAPYDWWGDYDGRSHSRQESQSIQEILTDEGLLYPTNKNSPTSSATHLRTQNDTDGIYEIYLFNFDDSENSIPLKSCYENGWWMTEADEHRDFKQVLMLDDTAEPANKDYQTELLNAILEKFGTPDYLKYVSGTNGEEGFYEKLAEKEGTLYYNMIYEYPEFTLEIAVGEMIMSKSNTQILEVYSVRYYPESCWAAVKQESELFQIR